jgi:hypothetical protein
MGVLFRRVHLKNTKIEGSFHLPHLKSLPRNHHRISEEVISPSTGWVIIRPGMNLNKVLVLQAILLLPGLLQDLARSVWFQMRPFLGESFLQEPRQFRPLLGLVEGRRNFLPDHK